MKYLLDTCIVSYLFKGHETIEQKLKSISPDCVCISVITEFEIEYGMFINDGIREKLKYKWDQFKEIIQILHYTSHDAYVAANIRANLKKNWNPIGAYDVLIGSQAINRNLILVTANISEFNKIDDMKLENWYN